MFMEEFRFFRDSIPEVDHTNSHSFPKTFLKFVACVESCSDTLYKAYKYDQFELTLQLNKYFGLGKFGRRLTGKQFRSSTCRSQRLQRKSYWPGHRVS